MDVKDDIRPKIFSVTSTSDIVLVRNPTGGRISSYSCIHKYVYVCDQKVCFVAPCQYSIIFLRFLDVDSFPNVFNLNLLDLYVVCIE